MGGGGVGAGGVVMTSAGRRKGGTRSSIQPVGRSMGPILTAAMLGCTRSG